MKKLNKTPSSEHNEDVELRLELQVVTEDVLRPEQTHVQWQPVASARWLDDIYAEEDESEVYFTHTQYLH